MPTVIDIENGTYEASEKIVEKDGSSYTEASRELTYLVISDNLTQTEVDILAATGIPAINQAISGLTCHARHPKEETRIVHPVTGIPAALWKVRCEFDNNTIPTTQTTARVSWSGEVRDRAFERDVITGQRVQTTAGEPIFATYPKVYPILTVEREESYPFPPLRILQYVHHTNSATFYGSPPATCIMHPIEVSEDQKNGARVCQVAYRIEFIMEWDYLGNLIPGTALAWLLNQGYMKRPEAGKKPIKNTDDKGHPILCNLNRDGTRMDPIKMNGATINDIDSSYTYIRSPVGFGGFSPITPVSDHIGGLITIEGASASNWITGAAYVIGIKTYGVGEPAWVITGDWGTVGGGGVITLEPPPLYLPYNRHYPVDFNALSLGPY